MNQTVQRIRNIAMIAHVDHGKTTLVDKLMMDSGLFRANETVQERAMDSMDLEREKGITIRAKNASIEWKDTIINIVDTPGHADFGGEVERILKMVDGALLLVDAAEGTQAQTRFVLRKAIENGLRLIVVINKVDREMANPARVHDQVLELLMELNASEQQFNAQFFYGSAKEGFMSQDPSRPGDSMSPLLDAIVEHIPPPEAVPDSPFEMLVSNLDWNDYVGVIAVGKLTGGAVSTGDSIHCLHENGTTSVADAQKIFRFAGLQTAESERAGPGEIVGIAGFDNVHIGETLAGGPTQARLPSVAIDPPTIQMQFCVNDGPLAGRDGKYVTSRNLRERLTRETRTNVSLEVADTGSANVFTIRARGDLQVAVVAESMRREGFELLISRPEVIYHEEKGKRLEPIEDLWLDIPQRILGDMMKYLSDRKGEIVNMEHAGDRVKLTAVIPTRGVIGMETYLTNASSGEGVMSHMFKEYAPFVGHIPTRTSGALVSMEFGKATAYSLDNLQQRGRLFIGPQEEVYPGMVVGENSRSGDLPCNPTKTKQLTNVRASGTDKAILLEPPTQMNLEKSIEFIAQDEFVEVTPNYLRLRKKILDANARKRMEKREAGS